MAAAVGGSSDFHANTFDPDTYEHESEDSDDYMHNYEELAAPSSAARTAATAQQFMSSASAPRGADGQPGDSSTGAAADQVGQLRPKSIAACMARITNHFGMVNR